MYVFKCPQVIPIEVKLLCNDLVCVDIDLDRGGSGAGITYYELSAFFFNFAIQMFRLIWDSVGNFNFYVVNPDQYF